MNRGLPSVLVAVGYGALIVASWGIASLMLDQDVMHYPDAGPLLGPVMALGAMAVTLGWVVKVRKGGGIVVCAVGATASAWLVMLVIGAVGYTLTRGVLAWLLLFAGDYAGSAFVLAPAILAGLVVLATGVLSPRAKPFAAPRRED
jgi:hypothetical protein